MRPASLAACWPSAASGWCTAAPASAIMGAVADADLRGGGEVIGVIPKALVQHELAHDHLTELRVVASMHERKALMAELSDAVIALPGGYGTFEELFETITWSQLGIHDKAIGVLNIGGFYDGLLALVDHAVEEGFIPEQHRALVLEATEPEAMLDLLDGVRAAATRRQVAASEPDDTDCGGARPVALTQITTWYLEMTDRRPAAAEAAARPGRDAGAASTRRARSSAASSTGRSAATGTGSTASPGSTRSGSTGSSRWRPGSAYVDGTPAGYFELQTACRTRAR